MTAIVVLGLHRSGTSAVAGVLYHLGVPLGDDLIGPGHGNPTGHFEDNDFVTLHNVIIGDWKDPKVNFEPHRQLYTMLIREREARHNLWGVKDPRMCFVFPYFQEIANDVRVISVYRNPHLCAESLLARGGHTLEEAVGISERYQKQKLTCLSDLRSPVFVVRYDNLVDRPEDYVTAIAAFVGLEPTQKAMDFIDPVLCHHRR